MRGPPRQPIDGFSCADSVIALLDHLPLQKLPEEERIALAAIQTRAIETFLDASPLPFAGDQGSFRFEPRELPHTLPEDPPAESARESRPQSERGLQPPH